eukprot:scaffold229207_cov18-Prasinocladus_malaysianus.AAC.2
MESLQPVCVCPGPNKLSNSDTTQAAPSNSHEIGLIASKRTISAAALVCCIAGLLLPGIHLHRCKSNQ